MEQAIKQAKISEWVSISNKLANEFNIEKYLPKDDIDNQILYHYTSLDALLSMCRNNSIWLSRIDSLNDPTEGKSLVKILNRILNSDDFCSYQYLNERKFPHSDLTFLNNFNFDINVYILSLVSEADNLTMWRFYGQNACGCSLGFDQQLLEEVMYIKNLQKSIEPKISVRKVCYDEKQHESIVLQVIADFDYSLKEIENELYLTNFTHYTHVLVKWLQSLSHFFKASCYAHENEVRLVCDFTDKNGHIKDYLRYRLVNDKIVPYIELCNSGASNPNEIPSFINSIILGCKSNPVNLIFLKDMYLRNTKNKIKYNHIDNFISMSDKPYR